MASLFENNSSSENSLTASSEESIVISGEESQVVSSDQSFASSKDEETLVSEEGSSSITSSIDVFSYPIYDNVDVDLTSMNATMVYAEVFNMMNNPGDYLDKIVKVSGPFVPFGSTSPDYCYPAILIKDATACCANGLEFLLYGTPRCSMEGGNGYPLYNEEATIVGRFTTYLEGNYLYVHLVDAIWLK